MKCQSFWQCYFIINATLIVTFWLKCVVESLKKNKDFIFLYLSLVNCSVAFKGEKSKLAELLILHRYAPLNTWIELHLLYLKTEESFLIWLTWYVITCICHMPNELLYPWNKDVNRIEYLYNWFLFLLNFEEALFF